MLEKLFDRLPYDSLENVKPVMFFAGGAVLGMVFFAAFYFTLYQSGEDKYAELEQKKIKTERTLIRYRSLVTQKERINKDLTLVSGELAKTKEQLPRQDEMPELLKKVNDFGRGLGLEVLIFRMEEGKVKDYYLEIPITLSMRGGFWETIDFFDAMQNYLKVVNFSNLKMQVKKVDIYEIGGAATPVDNIPMLHTLVQAKTFVYVEGAENKGINPPKPKKVKQEKAG